VSGVFDFDPPNLFFKPFLHRIINIAAIKSSNLEKANIKVSITVQIFETNLFFGSFAIHFQKAERLQFSVIYLNGHNFFDNPCCFEIESDNFCQGAL